MTRFPVRFLFNIIIWSLFPGYNSHWIRLVFWELIDSLIITSLWRISWLKRAIMLHKRFSLLRNLFLWVNSVFTIGFFHCGKCFSSMNFLRKWLLLNLFFMFFSFLLCKLFGSIIWIRQMFNLS